MKTEKSFDNSSSLAADKHAVESDSYLQWNELLSDFIQENVCSDYSSYPPNKKYLHMGLYLPSSQVSHQHLAIVIDTSQALPETFLDTFFDEIESIRLDVEALVIELIIVNGRIEHDTFVYGEPLEVGVMDTDSVEFQSPFDFIEEEGMDIAALIYITQTRDSFPKYEPEYPLLWIVPKDLDFPFGEKIAISDIADD